MGIPSILEQIIGLVPPPKLREVSMQQRVSDKEDRMCELLEYMDTVANKRYTINDLHDITGWKHDTLREYVRVLVRRNLLASGKTYEHGRVYFVTLMGTAFLKQRREDEQLD